MRQEEVQELLQELPGKISYYYKDLISGETWSSRERETMMAASVIKLFIMAAAFQKIERKELDPDLTVTMRREDYVPSCGAVAYMHEGLQVTVMDLITLMIILSDNTATNVLVDLIGMEEINCQIRELGYEDAWLGRKMYDMERAKRGIQNHITAGETGRLLEDIYRGRLVSETASAKMLEILKNQRLNGKIPFFIHALENAPRIAHKTGEDTGITHDVGIVLGERPFVLCFCGNETDVAAYERRMADIALRLYQENGV